MTTFNLSIEEHLGRLSKKHDALYDEMIKMQERLYRRTTLDLAIILGLVILGSLWAEGISAMVKQTIFRRESVPFWYWILVALAATIVFLLVLKALRIPLLFFA